MRPKEESPSLSVRNAVIWVAVRSQFGSTKEPMRSFGAISATRTTVKVLWIAPLSRRLAHSILTAKNTKSSCSPS